ncbi:hypothetical protein CPLU01_05099 [Colletotrichum plurivorum]|uniref:Uncharacterized protein n=1 Tax=Colletotrichum plurivorum TaxID=2175906 RepID=A0A8H6NIW0_9PEZI|nr:hypothetical protein CPLU01_05099 [Colletotrichum plurivorum]
MQDEGATSGQQYLSILTTKRAPKPPPPGWHFRDLDLHPPGMLVHHAEMHRDPRPPPANQDQRAPPPGLPLVSSSSRSQTDSSPRFETEAGPDKPAQGPGHGLAPLLTACRRPELLWQYSRDLRNSPLVGGRPRAKQGPRPDTGPPSITRSDLCAAVERQQCSIRTTLVSSSPGHLVFALRCQKVAVQGNNRLWPLLYTCLGLPRDVRYQQVWVWISAGEFGIGLPTPCAEEADGAWLAPGTRALALVSQHVDVEG